MTNVSQTIAGGTPTAATNGTTRLASIKVITADTFNVTLTTNKVNLIGSIRDHDADGDSAILSIDKNYDLNNNGTVDFRTPGDYKYGFEAFTTANTPGYNSADNNGTYTQSIDTTKLSEGYHYVTARDSVIRANEPAIFSDFKQTIYVDRLKPVSAVASFVPWDQNNTQNSRSDGPVGRSDRNPGAGADRSAREQDRCADPGRRRDEQLERIADRSRSIQVWLFQCEQRQSRVHHRDPRDHRQLQHSAHQREFCQHQPRRRAG